MNGTSSDRYAVMGAVGLMLLQGLASCGANPPGGAGNGGTGGTSVTSCPDGGMPPTCDPGDLAGTSGGGSCPAVTTLTGPLGPFGPTRCSAGTCP